MQKIILTLFLSILTVTLAAEVRISALNGGNKWGYSGAYAGIFRDLRPAAKLTVCTVAELAPFSGEVPFPRESWFGILLEDTRQRTRFCAVLFNPAWNDAPKELIPTLIGYVKGGNMERKSAPEKMPVRGSVTLTVTLSGGKLVFECRGESGASRLEYDVPEGFVPNRLGLTVDSYQPSGVGGILFRTLFVTCDGEEEEISLDSAKKWTVDSRTLAYFPGEKAEFPARKLSDVSELGIAGRGEADLTAKLQELLDNNNRRLSFSAGVYPIGALRIPSGSTLEFAPGAVWKAIGDVPAELSGNDITLDGTRFDLSSVSRKQVIRAQKCERLRFLNCSTSSWEGRANVKEAIPPNRPNLFELENCRDIEISGGHFADLKNVVEARYSSRLTVRDNRAERCNGITHFANGSDALFHYGNGSINVRYQCYWWGGDSNDRKTEMARIVQRGLRPGDPGFDPQQTGVFDILVENNIAEYGTTLAWGSKGRNVVISGNFARYMYDMAYDTEGGENVLISNNISINSACAGIGCYFYGERVLITGNQVFVFDEGDPKCRGNFIRLHSPGRADHFGNGQIMVSNNQFSAETEKPRTCGVEAARKVYFLNNTFKNGGISSVPAAEEITIAANVFENEKDADTPVIRLTGGIQHILKDNIFRLSGKSSVSAVLLNKINRDRVVDRNNIFLGWTREIEVTADK